ncbi:hypothetical protein Tco_0218881 [Tanacetum coccineum]
MKMDKGKESSLPKLGSSTEPKVCNVGSQPAFLDWYGYSTFDEFPAGTDEETSNNETIDKNKTVGNIGKNILFYEYTIEKAICKCPQANTCDEIGKKKGYRNLGIINDEADEHEISLEHDINVEYLTEAYLQQLLQDEQALRETLEDDAKHEKEWEAKMKKEETHDELFRMEFEVISNSESD